MRAEAGLDKNYRVGPDIDGEETIVDHSGTLRVGSAGFSRLFSSSPPHPGKYFVGCETKHRFTIIYNFLYGECQQ